MRPPGFNRWLVPPAALAIHLCIGMAYGFSVFWLPLSRALGVEQPKACPDMTLVQELFTTTCDWSVASMGWMYTLFFVLLGIVGRDLGRLARARRARARRAVVVGAVLVRRLSDLGARRLHPSALADVARLGRDRRHRPRPRLHLAGLDADQMVPRPARHGDRHGHHGLRRRRDDRRAAGRLADELFRDPDLGRRLGDLRRDGRHLLRLHDDRRLRLSRAAGRLAARGLDAAGESQRDDHAEQRASQ